MQLKPKGPLTYYVWHGGGVGGEHHGKTDDWPMMLRPTYVLNDFLSVTKTFQNMLVLKISN